MPFVHIGRNPPFFRAPNHARRPPNPVRRGAKPCTDLSNNIAFGREVLSVKAHKGKALDGLTDGDFDAEPSPSSRLIPQVVAVRIGQVVRIEV